MAHTFLFDIYKYLLIALFKQENSSILHLAVFCIQLDKGLSCFLEAFLNNVVCVCVCVEGNIYEISRSMRCKNREKYASKKTITQDNIYVVW